MTRLVASLTRRGRYLAGTGLVGFLVAYGLGDRDLARLGLLLLLAPFIAAWAVSRTRTTLATQRWLSTARVPAGDQAEVRIRLTNLSRVPSGTLLAQDDLPPALAERPRFVVYRLPAHAAVEISYGLRCETRGRYRVGPLSVRIRDPFGLCELHRQFSDLDELVVTPRVHVLPPIHLTGEWAGLGTTTRRSVSAAGEDDVSVREYRLGDDLRRVHWRSTAHRGELMVRREEQPWESRAVLLLDTRLLAHAGSGTDTSLEWAVSAAASIGVHLDGQGYALRLVLDTGATVEATRTPEGFPEAMLDALATAPASRSASLAAGLAALRQGGGEGLLVAVVAAPEPADVEAMVRAREPGVTGVAVLVDSAQWAGTESTALRRAMRLLTLGGWRVVTAGPGADIAELWRHVGSMVTLPAPRLPAPEPAGGVP